MTTATKYAGIFSIERVVAFAILGVAITSPCKAQYLSGGNLVAATTSYGSQVVVPSPTGGTAFAGGASQKALTKMVFLPGVIEWKFNAYTTGWDVNPSNLATSRISVNSVIVNDSVSISSNTYNGQAGFAQIYYKLNSTTTRDYDDYVRPSDDSGDFSLSYGPSQSNITTGFGSRSTFHTGKGSWNDSFTLGMQVPFTFGSAFGVQEMITYTGGGYSHGGTFFSLETNGSLILQSLIVTDTSGRVLQDYVAFGNGGADYRLDYTAIPEPDNVSLLIGAFLLTFAICRRLSTDNCIASILKS